MDDYQLGHAVGFSNGWDKALDRMFYAIDNIEFAGEEGRQMLIKIEKILKEMRK